MSVILSFATNDDHGNDTGRVSAIHLDDALELQWGEIGSEPRYSVEGSLLRISRRKFIISGVRTWYGNMVWTGIALDDDEAVRLLNYLSEDDRWHCEGGWCDLSDAYVEGKVTRALISGTNSQSTLSGK
jgi:hypothetical protein